MQLPCIGELSLACHPRILSTISPRGRSTLLTAVDTRSRCAFTDTNPTSETLFCSPHRLSLALHIQHSTEANSKRLPSQRLSPTPTCSRTCRSAAKSYSLGKNKSVPFTYGDIGAQFCNSCWEGVIPSPRSRPAGYRRHHPNRAYCYRWYRLSGSFPPQRRSWPVN